MIIGAVRKGLLEQIAPILWVVFFVLVRVRVCVLSTISTSRTSNPFRTGSSLKAWTDTTP